MTKRAAIILAGGKAERFQSSQGKWTDKALATLNGKPLLVHAIENLQGIVDETVVVVEQNPTRVEQYQDILTSYNLSNARIVTDLTAKNLSGPLIAIYTGLKLLDADHCITVPCDVPMLSRKVAKYLFDEINGSLVAVPMWPNGRLETLLMVLERKSTLEITDTLVKVGRSHPDDIIRGAQKALFVSPLGKIKELDPELKSFVNINCPEDLNRLQPRQDQGVTDQSVRLNLWAMPTHEIGCLAVASLKRDSADFTQAADLFMESAIALQREKAFFWAALGRELEAKSLLDLFNQKGKRELLNQIKWAFLNAAENYRSEAKVYDSNRCFLLAYRAGADKSWCEQQTAKLPAK